MSDNRPIVHLFCNAHLDPVWMWGWEEGLREAISTFRSAVTLLEEFPEFIFNHNESLLYEWVENHDPPLFARIQALVREGRWNITGGWYLQPDLNIPLGETLVRVILEGRRYFQEKFGIRSPVAYNFDSFGHPDGLPQLLVQAGFELYVHCRPTAYQLELPGSVYRWRGGDGSEVLAVRPDTGWYGTPKPGQAQEQARNGIRIARDTGRDVLVTWGLGNHGGGATRHDLQLFRTMIGDLADGDIELRHSTPEAYLERIRTHREEFPVFEGGLQRTFAGTYTSVAPIKRHMRATESLLDSAERWAALAWWRYGQTYPAEELRTAWKQLMFNTFHDILCGSLIETAIPEVLDIYGAARHTARQVLLKAQHALLPNVPPEPETIPIYVFNPHSVPMRMPVGLNVLSAHAPPLEKRPMTLYDDTDTPVIHQTSGGSAVLEMGTWQPFIGFVAEVAPFTVRRYELRFQDRAQPDHNALSAEITEPDIIVQNRWWEARFSHQTAALEALIMRETGRNLLNGAVQLMVMKDVADAWGGETRVNFSDPVGVLAALSPEAVGAFYGYEKQTGPALRIIHQGLVSITVEGLVGWQHTRAAVQITLYADVPFVDINTRVYMQARRKMIKLALPFDLPDVRAICEVPYSSAECPADSTEYPCGRWVRLETLDLTVGMADNGQAGFDVAESGLLHLSLTRGGVHCSWEGEPGSERLTVGHSHTYMDQEQIDTGFRLVAGADRAEVAAQLIPAALALNQPLESLFTHYPPTPRSDAPTAPSSFIQVEPATVIVSALKKAEQGDTLIVRLAETVGQPTVARVTIEQEEPRTITFGPHAIKTFRLNRANGAITWEPTTIVED
jgi:alpha-mannosidase